MILACYELCKNFKGLACAGVRARSAELNEAEAIQRVIQKPLRMEVYAAFDVFPEPIQLGIH